VKDPREELLNVYDAAGAVVDARPRREAKRSGLAVGAVNVLLVNALGQILLQRRPTDRENGGRWDKSVGGHVSAGETFDVTVVREAGEELFEDPHSPFVRLVPSAEDFPGALAGADLTRTVVFRQFSFQRNLRDVRHAPEGGFRNVLYHVAIYLGRTDIPISGFHPQASEVEDLRYFPAGDLDQMLLTGSLAPNMAFLWLTHAADLLALVRP
jgi:8-oxo-dGTP pyrophosphatase MutT (NUDIX family)